MNPPYRGHSTPIHETIANRTGIGPNQLVGGWQQMLTDLLDQMEAYLRPGQLITFRDLRSDEKETFAELLRHLQLPDTAFGLFLPPSVRNQMMYLNRGRPIPEEARHSADDGVVLLRRTDVKDPLVNVLLARPPHTAAIDVYSEQALLAGYTYRTPAECIDHLQQVVDTHLRPPQPAAD
ncbi:MAG: hypothetical protein QNJ22_15820 [Desulfosarcinaceae bacterium]|nr:hypothetical protein [Desulfosarcinaceae bacterium]